MSFVYVVDENQQLIDDIRIGEILMAEDDATLESVLNHQFISLRASMPKEEAISVFEKYDRAALPVLSDSGLLVGIVTFDDILDQVVKRDTEDIQKFGSGSAGFPLSQHRVEGNGAKESWLACATFFRRNAYGFGYGLF